MNKIKILVLSILLILVQAICTAQLSPINFETGGYGASWNWTTFENDVNPAVQIVSNPLTTGINSSSTVAQFTALQAGQPWAGFESLHGAGIGTFTLSATNSIVKVMVYKSVISDVGVKFATNSNASTGELKVANTIINEWEELTFDFTSQIGHPAMTDIDQIIIFPDFDLSGRTGDNVCYIDNITMGTPSSPINVTFSVQNTDSMPVYIFGDWNNWSNFPGTPMTLNTSTGNYEAIISINPNSPIEYQFVNGSSTKEILDSTWACTNGNGQFTNRLTQVGNADTSICHIWESCSTCIPLSTKNYQLDDIEILAGNKFVRVNSNEYHSFDKMEVIDIMGKVIYSSEGIIPANKNLQIFLNYNQQYIVRVLSQEKVFYKKLIILK